ncbi:hypothetical protein IscW_ISCW021222 [Ixodes scapularis]|uniref:Uncharacterized protein n=1 Tax=Ixodes scapularis TaxID=6945 RepID=B7Q7E8_IXOSC|nr:hypothetical protein IscW_ISCW021222 [Ixodes scapularis]|eukprot:XP_002403960.1 hypothetical protein IscW_ISCW021222 [Ixodes scapularis]
MSPVCADFQEMPATLEADCVYVQMKKQYRVSRYIRAQWFVSQIGKTIQPKQPKQQTEGEISGEVEVLSAIPRVCPAGWCPERAHEFTYLVTPATKVTFLAKKYRFVFCLDLSASVATVDIRSETLLFDEVLSTLSRCIEKLVMPFYVPGSCLVFQPEIYVTVIAYIPHYTPAVQQVLIQGWPLTLDNWTLFQTHVEAGLREICIVLAEATAGVAELHDQLRLQSEKLTGGLFEEGEEQAAPTSLVNMAPSDVSTLGMLKYGMLALQLLPENSSAGELEIKLVLPWKFDVNLEYVVMVPWPASNKRDGDKPVSFYVTRVTYKAPCMVIRFAFLGGTPGDERNAIVKELTDQILSLELSKRLAKDSGSDSGSCLRLPKPRTYQKASCCILFRKPLERILIRHEKMPRDVLSMTAAVPDSVVLLGHQRISGTPTTRKGATGGAPAGAAVDPTSQLSRYLHHRRWVWTVQRLVNVPLPLHAVTRILKTLANLSDDEDNEVETAEADGELQLVTECWVEPQCGVVVNCPVSCSYLEGKQYTDIPKALFEKDFECLSSLITLEHLNLSCVKPELPCPSAHSQRLPPTPPVTPALGPQPSLGARSTPDVTFVQTLSLPQPVAPEPTVGLIPFCFSIIKLLSKCQQTEILLSTFVQELTPTELDNCGGHAGLGLNGRPAPEPNDILYDQLLENLQALHDQEIPLTHDENAVFPNEIHNRPRDVHAHGMPFDLPPVDLPPVLWRCFVASFSGVDGSEHPSPNSHVVLSFLPASYSNLRRLMMPRTTAPPVTNVQGRPANWHSPPPGDYSLLRTESSSDAVLPSESTPGVTSTPLKSRRPSSPFSASEGDLHQLGSARSEPALLSACSDLAGGRASPQRRLSIEAVEPCEVNDLDSTMSEWAPPHPPAVSTPLGGEAGTEEVARRVERVSIVLPVYVYDAPVSAVIGRLVYTGGVRKWKDTYMDLTLKAEEERPCSVDPGWLENRPEGMEGSLYKTVSPEPKSDDSEIGGDRFLARKHCSRLRKAFSKSFVYGVFRQVPLSREVIDCLDNSQPTLDLEDVKIRLDFLCLTLPPDVERLSSGRTRHPSPSSPNMDAEGQHADDDADSVASLRREL